MPPSAQRTALAFDLDGTLIDSAPDLHVAVNRMLAEAGEAPLDLATVISFIGNGIPNLVRLAMAARGMDPARQAHMNARMLALYSADPATLTEPYPGVRAALARLRSEGCRLGLCTNKAMVPTLGILRALDLERSFDAVVGGDTLPVKKPDPAPLVECGRLLGGEVDFYVGDSEVDAETARRAARPFDVTRE